MILDLPLAHAGIDPDTSGRTREGLVGELLDGEDTVVVLVDELGDLAVAGSRLDTVAGADYLELHGSTHVYLGRDAEGRGHVLAIGPRHDGHDYHDLRTVMASMPAGERAVAVPALAIANWHRHSAFCPRCGERTEVEAAGWVRRCHGCGTEHYPRTDPAVIMSVIDGSDRLLLAHASHFPRGRYSMVAGYVEPGESIEHAVVRETREEVGMEVAEVIYRGSQPWPFPRSLMFAFEARVLGTPEAQVDGVEITDARFFTRAELAAAVAAGEVGLPGVASVAYSLLEAWYGGPIPAPGP